MLKNYSSIADLKEFKEGFQAVIDQDFNPDFVELFGIDMFEYGFQKGLGYGIAGVFTIGAGFFIGKKLENYVKKKYFNKPDKEL